MNEVKRLERVRKMHDRLYDAWKRGEVSIPVVQTLTSIIDLTVGPPPPGSTLSECFTAIFPDPDRWGLPPVESNYVGSRIANLEKTDG